MYEKETCLVVYTKDKAAKCRSPALDLLIKVSPLPDSGTLHLLFKILMMSYFNIHNMSRYCISQRTLASPRISKLAICSTSFMESYVRRISCLIQVRSVNVIITFLLIFLNEHCNRLVTVCITET